MTKNNPIAYVLLKTAVSPNMVQLAETLRARHPDLAVDAPTQAGPVLKCSGMLVAVMSIEAPLPFDEALVTRASATWPGAGVAFQACTAHLVVAVMGRQDHPLAAARATTAVVEGLLSVVPESLVVVWNGAVALPAQIWADLGQAAFAPYPRFPSRLWVSLHFFRDTRTGGVGVVTHGLRGFVDRELELVSVAGDLDLVTAWADTLATYLIEKGPVLEDGSTFGVSEAERIPVRLCESERFEGLPVISALLAETGTPRSG